jgi:hypothetical protein
MTRFKRTNTKNLYQQKSDSQFYLAAKINGKTKWEALGTDVRALAEDKLTARLKQLRGASQKATSTSDYTFGEALNQWRLSRQAQRLNSKTINRDGNCVNKVVGKPVIEQVAA